MHIVEVYVAVCLCRPKSTWKRELQNELKKEIDKTLSEASTVAASKEKWKDLLRGLCST